MTVVDAAFRRYIQLSAILERARRSALAQPTGTSNTELGLFEVGQVLKNPKVLLQTTFEQLQRRIEYLCLLDMCSAFEGYVRLRIDTSIGEVRRVTKEHYNISTLETVSTGLVRETKSFDSLQSIFLLVQGHFPADRTPQLETVRKERNRFAHGSDLSYPLQISLTTVQALLNEVIIFLC